MDYLVIRIRDIYRYHEYFGPMVSTPQSAHRDAERLYGRTGYSIKVKAWGKAAKHVKDRLDKESFKDQEKRREN